MNTRVERGKIAISVLNLAESWWQVALPWIYLTPSRVKARMEYLGYEYIQDYPLRGRTRENQRCLEGVTLVTEHAWYGNSRWSAFDPSRIALDGYGGFKSLILDAILFPGRKICTKWQNEMESHTGYAPHPWDDPMPDKWQWTIRKREVDKWEYVQAIDIFHFERLRISGNSPVQALGTYFNRLNMGNQRVALVYFHVRNAQKLEKFLDVTNMDDDLTQVMQMILERFPNIDIVVKLEPFLATTKNLVVTKTRLEELQDLTMKER